MKKINIAIDGHSSCGKSTTSKILARKLAYKYIDTGAMYRAVTLYMIENDIDFKDEEVLMDTLPKIQVDFRMDPEKGNRTTLNGRDVEDDIRTMKVSALVSPVSTIPSVRRKLVEQQQVIAAGKGVVMDGRDIGTVVLPNAELKVFMTASLEARAKRRWEELKRKGQDISLEEVSRNLSERDRIDSGREDSPLKMADDAILLDTTGITIEDQTAWLEKKVALVLESDQ